MDDVIIRLENESINLSTNSDIYKDVTILIKNKYDGVIYCDNTSLGKDYFYWCVPDDKSYLDGFDIEIFKDGNKIYDSSKNTTKKFDIDYVIKNSYSQVGQDVFSFLINDKKTNGYFIDLGSSHPIDGNNTYILERMGWFGLSFDIDNSYDLFYKNSRRTPFIKCDVGKNKISSLFQQYNLPKVIDYMSIDIEEASEELLLKTFPHEYEFKCITFEHNLCLDDRLKNISRGFFAGKQYTLLCENVAVSYRTNHDIFEDWYINEKYVDLNKFIFLESKDLHWKEIIKRIDNFDKVFYG